MPDEPAAAVEEPQTPEIPDLDPDTIAAVLNRYHDDPERRAALTGKLRTHPFVSNVAGDLPQRQRQADKEAEATVAAERERERLRDLRRTDPVAYATEMDTKEEIELADKRAKDARDTARREYIDRVGTALRGIPEVQSLTAEEHAAYVRAVAGATEDDVLPITQRFFTDLIATKRAKVETEKVIAERLKAERKAWEKEQADKRLRARSAPSAAAPPTGNAQDTGEPDFRKQPKEWEAWYDAKRKAGTLVGQRR
jgi:hypothetical protein